MSFLCAHCAERRGHDLTERKPKSHGLCDGCDGVKTLYVFWGDRPWRQETP